ITELEFLMAITSGITIFRLVPLHTNSKTLTNTRNFRILRDPQPKMMRGVLAPSGWGGLDASWWGASVVARKGGGEAVGQETERVISGEQVEHSLFVHG